MLIYLKFIGGSKLAIFEILFLEKAQKFCIDVRINVLNFEFPELGEVLAESEKIPPVFSKF